MGEYSSSTSPNTRKQFLRCADCGCQTLSQNVSQERPWAAAASLYVSGRVNDGALCFDCANNRRAWLGLPPAREPARTEGQAPACEARVKKVRINTQEYSWEIGTLESLLTKWRDGYSPKSLRNRDIKLLLAAVNDVVIPARKFGSVPIFEGDAVTIVAGAIAGG